MGHPFRRLWRSAKKSPKKVERVTKRRIGWRHAADDVDIASLAVSQVAVKKETLDLMAQMFPVGGHDTGTVRWTQYVQALVDAGMIATQSAGSAVTFKVLDQSITFHKPHPEPEIDAIKLRIFAKLLSKKYGWINETFVLRQKVSAGVQEDALEWEARSPRSSWACHSQGEEDEVPSWSLGGATRLGARDERAPWSGDTDPT
jgi:hypothetical protein